MEEVDKIIIPILSEIGCSFPTDVSSISHFGSAHVYHAAATILSVIHHQPGEQMKYPPCLPKGTAARFRLTTDLAKDIVELGFRGLGYEAFLYPNEQDIRKLLIWLVDKLPKHDDTDGGEAMLAGEMDSSLDRRVHNAMHGWIRQPHLHASFLVARCEGEYGTINSASSSSPSSQKASHHCLLSTLPLELPVPHSTPNTLLSSDDSLDDSFPASSSALSAPVSSSALVPGTALTQAYLQNHQRSLPSQTMHADLPCLAASIFEKNAASSVYGEERAREWDSLQGEKSLREIQASKHAFVSALISEAFATVQDTKPTSSASSATSSSIFLGMGDAYKSKSAVNSAFTRRTVFAQETGDMQAQVVTTSGIVETVSAAGNIQNTESESKLKEEREKTLADLNRKLDKVQRRHVLMLSTMEDNIKQARHLEAQLQEMSMLSKHKTEQYKLKRQSLDLLPEAERNIAKLEDITRLSEERVLALAREWEEHRSPLVHQLRRKRQQLRERKEEVVQKVDQIKRMRKDMKVKASDIREKDHMERGLAGELAKMPKSVNRQTYVKRIMDIVKNLDKQKLGIREILGDVRSVQKDINNVTKTSARSFAIADETVFQVAKTKHDDCATNTYKNIVTLREGFASLVKQVEDTGRIKNEIRDVTSLVEAVEGRNSELNLKRVMGDLKQVKQENKELSSELKKIRRHIQQQQQQ